MPDQGTTMKKSIAEKKLKQIIREEMKTQALMEAVNPETAQKVASWLETDNIVGMRLEQFTESVGIVLDAAAWRASAGSGEVKFGELAVYIIRNTLIHDIEETVKKYLANNQDKMAQWAQEGEKRQDDGRRKADPKPPAAKKEPTGEDFWDEDEDTQEIEIPKDKRQ